MTQILIKTDFERMPQWKKAATKVLSDYDILFWPEDKKRITSDCRYALVWAPEKELLSAIPDAEVIFSVGAGIDHIDLAMVNENVPIVRMVEPVLTEGMRDYVISCCLDFCRYFYRYRQDQEQKIWQPLIQRANAQWQIVVLGMGELGNAVAEQLVLLGFKVVGFARNPREKAFPVITKKNDLKPILGQSDIVINLLPLTEETQHFFDDELFGFFKQDSAFINAARGGHVDERALKGALSTTIKRAYLDVFAVEPLAENSFLWHHPKVQLTPHIASMTYPKTALEYVAEQIERYEQGEALPNVVNRTEGY